MTADLAALQRLLGGPETDWLVERARNRIAGGVRESGPLSGVVVLREPTRAQRAAIVRLIGPRARAGETLRVDLATVEEVLRRGPWRAGLADAIEALTGPIIDRTAARHDEAAAWDAARIALAETASRFPGLTVWWDTWCSSGGLKRCAHAELRRVGAEEIRTGPEAAAGLVCEVAKLLAVLPSDGEPLAVVARRITGDAHGLDAGRPLGRLAAAVVGAAFGTGSDLPARDVWAAAGVVVSHLTSTVLCLGVSGSTGTNQPRATATSVLLDAARSARMPVVLTLDQVRSGGVHAALPAHPVWVCENPTVLEVIANRCADGEAESPIVVCTWGSPTSAAADLLGILTSSGAQCRYHGDFDWPGIRIAAALHGKIPWQPWRFSSADYLELASTDLLSRPLTGRPAESPWDPALSSAMIERSLAIEEEAVADRLAEDVLGGRV